MTDDVPGKKEPLHIAIVPDGNRRWSRKKKKPVWYGHTKGARKLRQVLDWCLKHEEVDMVTVYALSTENLNRSKEEIEKLWDLYKREFKRTINNRKVKKNNLKFNIIGDSGAWRADVRQTARDLMRATGNYTRGVVNILLAYGSKFEILNAARKLVNIGIGKVPYAEEAFSKLLMVNRPVDLVIRTGNECRLSNFLLYQAAYAEIYFSKTLWPDFSKKEFEKILRWYNRREKRIGR